MSIPAPTYPWPDSQSNNFYRRVSDYTPFSAARGETLANEFEAIEHGFDLVTSALSNTLGQYGISVRYSAGDLGNAAIADTAAQRAGKVQAFDGSGAPVLRAPDEIDGYNGQATLTFNNHGFTALPTHGFIPVYAGPTGPVEAVASGVGTLASAFIVGIPDANRLRIARGGFLNVGAHGLAVGSMHFLDRTAPGITQALTGVGIVQALCEAWSADTLLLVNAQPHETA